MPNQTNIIAEPGGQAIIITREIDAPRSKVWQAYTDPDLVMQWQGPRGYKGEATAWKLKPGGGWAFTHTNPEGESFDFRGFFIQVKPEERLVQTFEFVPMEGHISLDTAIFEELDNGTRTKITGISVFQTPEDRDGMIQSGMEKGVREGYERLDELLVKD